MCESCLQLVEVILASRTRGTHFERVNLGQPLTRTERMDWVRRRLPRTAATIDLDGWFTRAEPYAHSTSRAMSPTRR
jgi:hypothetical protein